MMLRVDRVWKRLGGRRVVDDVSFTCAGGQIAVVAGPNGAGKSTLLSMIAGIVEPDGGIIELVGAVVGQPAGQARLHRAAAARRNLGYVPEAAAPPAHMTGKELLQLVRALKRCAPLPEALHERLGLGALASKPMGQLSLGERRRMCLGAALVGEPLLLILDEPTNGLDTAGVATLAELLIERRQAGAAIVLATHDHDFADAIVDIRLSLDQGRLQ